jgi:excinuclease UvrABC nuclease subunit
MDDPLLPPKNRTSLADFIPRRMLLSPAHWKACKLPQKLSWEWTKFTRSNSRDVPNDKSGVYSFLVQPGIADHPACSYLMYVGKAEKQSLRERFNQYFRDESDESRRLHIHEMFRLWKGHLWFYFAPISDNTKIDAVELALIHAYLPPRNHEFKGSIKRQIQKLFG